MKGTRYAPRGSRSPSGSWRGAGPTAGAGRADVGDARIACAVGEEVEALLTNDPACGAGQAKQVREILAVQSVLLPHGLVRLRIEVMTAS